MAELKLKPSTLLLTRSGTIGTVSLVSKTTEGTVFSDDVIRVTFKNPYDLGYVYAFLKTKHGSVVLQTNGYGSVITHLEPEHLTTIPIPNAPDEIKRKIHVLVIVSYHVLHRRGRTGNPPQEHCRKRGYKVIEKGGCA